MQDTFAKITQQKEFCVHHRHFLVAQISSLSMTAESIVQLHSATIPRSALLFLPDLYILQQCTSLRIQFAIRERQHRFDRFILLANNDEDCLTKQQISENLPLPIICCDQSTDGNNVGSMTLCSKITINQTTIQSAVQLLINQFTSTIAKLPVVNPLMKIQQQTANQSALRLTSMIATTSVFSHVCLHGLPSYLLTDRHRFLNLFIRMDNKNPGIGTRLGIPQPHRLATAIRAANTGLHIHKILDVTSSSTPHYIDGNQVVVIQLLLPIETSLPWRTTMMDLPINISDKHVSCLLAATFIPESIATSILSANEVAAIRPIPTDYVSPVCMTLLNYLQPKTSVTLHPIIMSSQSKLLLQSVFKKNNVIKYQEIICVVITTNHLDDTALEVLRRHMKTFNCTFESTIQPIPSMTFQLSSNMRSLSYLPYPKSMTIIGKHKYIILCNSSEHVSPSYLLQQLQTYLPSLSHHFVVAFNALLHNKTNSIIIVTDSKVDVSMLANELRTIVLSHKMAIDDYPSIETTATLPGFYSQNSLLLNKLPVVHFNHPTESSSWSTVKAVNSTPNKLNVKTSNSTLTSSVKSSSSSSQSVLSDFYSTNTVPPAPPPSNNNN